jgi:hypothetical protein
MDSKSFDENDASVELTPQWILDQRQKCLEREKKSGKVVGAVSASHIQDAAAEKKTSKNDADHDLKPAAITKGMSSYWEAQFRRESVLHSEGVGAISDDSPTEKAEDIKARAQEATKPQSLDERRPTFDSKSVQQKNQTSRDSHVKKSSQEEATQEEGEVRLTPTWPAFGSQTNNSASHEQSASTNADLPGAYYAQAGPGVVEEPTRRDSAVEEVLASLQQSDPANINLLSSDTTACS